MITRKTVGYNGVSIERRRIGLRYGKDDFNAVRKITTYWVLCVPVYRRTEYLEVTFG